MHQKWPIYVQMLLVIFVVFLSGAISALIAVKITNQFGWNFNLQFLLSALVSALTVGGKAIGKDLANKKIDSNSTYSWKDNVKVTDGFEKD